ncbi:helicase-related protein [Caballeronia sp. LZ029]|uniref:helicase-related protein n=1 Tax=Caballeronia sp. LZ029 TaxID=3038564 RepID=UPI0028656AC6|nr:helicase-related protein [Caballeronia sp. LZ029]MDR5741596.1 helicase-related protein [Caballeronia sp. LZ029]
MESNTFISKTSRFPAFRASGETFKLAAEAYRMQFAHLFDRMMAIQTSNVEPLPHQVSAVYESMLPRQPLRYVLASDPGSGKTIMAGLLIRELLIRADAERVLIVAPGSLVDQWQDELSTKFGLDFAIAGRESLKTSFDANPFHEADLMVARIDQLARNDDLLDQLRRSRWDLIVVDEAHKLSATSSGNRVNRTKRFQLGELLGTLTRHFLLLTATPHNGKEEDFQLFMSLLDADRFCGKMRDGAQRADISDLMHRMVKEEMLRFDGTRLFPERRAYTTTYSLSDEETALYDAVTGYVREEMSRADSLHDGARRSAVGFALTSLQRRLASSPEAICRSLMRRREKFRQRIEHEHSRRRDEPIAYAFSAAAEDLWESADSLASADYEAEEERLVGQASAAQTIRELEAEIAVLEALEKQARDVVHSGQDRKWSELSNLLQNTPEMRERDGRQRKLIVFTEHRDTLDYLALKLRGLMGDEEAVVVIHGGVTREDRSKVQDLFRNDPVVRVLVATDAAGEGINLQNANLMVNYDLPWNPNRLEQRFGRIHRIGQTAVCHLWNMVAAGTREGDVFLRLFEKLDVEREALGGRVFDILGEVFENRSLKDLLVDAIRNDIHPESDKNPIDAVEDALDRRHLESIIARVALCEQVIDETRLFAVREDMEKAEARKLQPYFIQAFFERAFDELGGALRPREAGRFEITHVPVEIREHARRVADREGRKAQAVLPRYERIAFDKQHVRLAERPDTPVATLIHPAHPLMRAVTDLILERHRHELADGAVLIDPSDLGIVPRALFMIDHSVYQGDDPANLVSRRIQFIEIPRDGRAANAGFSPHLALDAATSADVEAIAYLLDEPWLGRDAAHIPLADACAQIATEHLNEVRRRREHDVGRTLKAVRERLESEIRHWSARYSELRKESAAGKDVRLALSNVGRTIDELGQRLETREQELNAMREIVAATPRVVGRALVIPAGLLAKLRGDGGWSADAAARARIEKIAMNAVIEAERTLGHDVIDVSAQKCGWDITSQPKARDGKLPWPRHIEVKGRAKGSDTVVVTANEMREGFNQQDKFHLAIVLVDDDTHEGPFYVARPFDRSPGWAETRVELNLQALLSRATHAE